MTVLELKLRTLLITRITQNLIKRKQNESLFHSLFYREFLHQSYLCLAHSSPFILPPLKRLKVTLWEKTKQTKLCIGINLRLTAYSLIPQLVHSVGLPHLESDSLITSLLPFICLANTNRVSVLLGTRCKDTVPPRWVTV